MNTDKTQRVHFESVNEPADYRGNRQWHTYLVVDGRRIAATKDREPNARLVGQYQRELTKLRVENEDCNGQNACAKCGASDYHTLACGRVRR